MKKTHETDIFLNACSAPIKVFSDYFVSLYYTKHIFFVDYRYQYCTYSLKIGFSSLRYFKTELIVISISLAITTLKLICQWGFDWQVPITNQKKVDLIRQSTHKQ